MKLSESEYSDLTRARASAAESVEIGRSILESLSSQNEKLSSTEDTLEANEHILKKSMTILRCDR